MLVKSADVGPIRGNANTGLVVTLGASLVAGSGNVNAAPVFGVAGGAIGRGNARGVMRGAVVATKAGAVGSFSGKCARLLDVASGAFFFEDRMSARHAAARVDAVVAGEAAPGDPEERGERQDQAQPELGALERCRPLEIVEVDALGELFSCACSGHDFFPLVAERHDSVNCAEQNQCERKRNVHEQPAVQPAMQAFLERELARFVANIFEIAEGSVS